MALELMTREDLKKAENEELYSFNTEMIKQVVDAKSSDVLVMKTKEVTRKVVTKLAIINEDTPEIFYKLLKDGIDAF